ncbi:DUF429 domain-containing protein [Nesterenkonia rhizosphaerae]
MREPVMRTAGVDLAAGNKRTALAVIEWNPQGARVEQLTLNVDDAEIVRVAQQVAKVGIDCALGWPDEFVSFVSAHAKLTHAEPVDGGMEWRRTLAYRETDRHVRLQTGRWPLSVSTDRLGLTAMRCAGLLGRLASSGLIVDRSGSRGVVVEVYPGATLRCWEWDLTDYRVNPAVRRTLIQQMEREAPWIDFGSHAELMVTSGDAFDAVLAAFTARAAARGLCIPPPVEHRLRAEREGWIALPSCGLGALL